MRDDVRQELWIAGLVLLVTALLTAACLWIRDVHRECIESVGLKGSEEARRCSFGAHATVEGDAVVCRCGR